MMRVAAWEVTVPTVPQIVPPTDRYCAPLSDTSVSDAPKGIHGKYKQ